MIHASVQHVNVISGEFTAVKDVICKCQMSAYVAAEHSDENC